MAYTIEEIKNVESTATAFIEKGDSVVIQSGNGLVLVSKILIDAKNKKPKVYNCMNCGEEINLTKNPNVNYRSLYPKRWLKFNLDGTPHKHSKKKSE